MARKQSRTFTEVELEFMQILWDNVEVSPEDIRNVLEKKKRSISSGSIRNVLAIMIRKDYVVRRKEGKGYLYRAKVKKDQARKNMIQELMVNAFDCSESLVVAALLNGKEIEDKELQEIRRLLKDHSGGNKQ